MASTALTLTLQAPAAPMSLPARAPVDLRAHEAVLDVVVPCYNEETDLEPCVRRLHAYLTASSPTRSGSRSPTTRAPTARSRSPPGSPPSCPTSRSLRLPEKGRGRALRTAWPGSDAPVLAYMDVDLSTDLAALLPLVAPLISGHSDLAIGTPAGPRRPGWSAAPSARSSRAATTCAARHAGRPVLRRPVRLQGHPRRRRRAAAAAGGGHRLVLRHRAARARRARRAAHPRGAGRLGRRPRQPGRHRRDGDGRPGRHRPAAAARWPPAASRSTGSGPASAAPHWPPDLLGRGPGIIPS